MPRRGQCFAPARSRSAGAWRTKRGRDENCCAAHTHAQTTAKPRRTIGAPCSEGWETSHVTSCPACPGWACATVADARTMSDDRAKKSRLIITTKPEMTPQPGAILNLLRAVSVWHFGCDWLGRGRCYQTVGRESPTRASRHRPCWRASAESTDHAAGVDFTDDGQRQNSVPTLERLSQCASSAAVVRTRRWRARRPRCVDRREAS